ncbi:MAG: hypothetical protein IPP72_16035 [Chitinophagaceae bacterium]|nr:hypothetical protein [Chitinophagaceae bacterium]
MIADPAIGQVSFTNISGSVIPDSLPLGYVAQLNIPIKNLSVSNDIPAGSCKIKIGLGSKIILEPGFILSLANTSQYFDWTAELNSGQVQLTGELKFPLPANFYDTAKFNIQGNILDYSTVTTNFLITNHNTPVILSDNDPANNSSFRPYKIIPPVPTPVNFSSVLAVKNNCSVDVLFRTENEINVTHFDIEISKDGIHFIKTGAINAAQLTNYKFSFPITPAVSSPVLYLRIKSVDLDGSYKYSITKTLNAECNSKGTLGIYPNPVKGLEYITVRSSGGLLNGKYRATLYDITGRYISGKELSLDNQQQFAYPLGNISSGQ